MCGMYNCLVYLYVVCVCVCVQIYVNLSECEHEWGDGELCKVSVQG